jgi:hypothetical protein
VHKSITTTLSPPVKTSVFTPINSSTEKDFAVSPHTLIDDDTLAKLLDVSPRTPAQWRYTGKFKKELPTIKVGRNRRTRLVDALAFIENQLTAGGTE